MPNDSILIKQLQEKDENALSALYDKYSGAIYGVILKMTRNEALSQELLQDTFITVWEKSVQYDPEKGRFYTWIYRIARNKVLNVLRKTEPLIQTEDYSVYNNKEEELQIDDHVLELKGAILKLEAHHKRAIDLVYFNGLTHKEAHEEMGVPLGTFKSYIRQALKHLRTSYDQALILVGLLIEVI